MAQPACEGGASGPILRRGLACWMRCSFGAEPHLRKRGQPHGSGLLTRRWPVERTGAWLLENKRPALRHGRLGFIVQALLQAVRIFLVAPRLTREF